MGRAWQVQEAKSRFSEFLETSLTEGPQIVTKRGVETAILVSIDQWRRLERRTAPDIKELLLAPGGAHGDADAATAAASAPICGQHRAQLTVKLFSISWD